ncbi:hypothetical protein BN938_1235 [Mucinivorans hirudinis]|uniref:Uncharacterized protein n=1 Tax=Mucinivorans hirudinis TaxID=1433126 RepID=A0A060RC43_9BACT|nr:hypothetical protein BN938_1235 [Mucinivorans hirudinis]
MQIERNQNLFLFPSIPLILFMQSYQLNSYYLGFSTMLK